MKPKQYLKGFCEFYKLKFKVTPDVLIPRPETELLVDEIINYCKLLTVNCPLILDIGTGSGCIAISLAKNLPKARIFATDISAAALDVARENARLNKVENRIFFIESDLLSAFCHPERSEGSLTNVSLVIVANLPYIPSSRLPFLDPSVIDFEPRIALDGGRDGFNLYKKLFQQISQGVNLPHTRGEIRRHLRTLQLLVCEIGYTQGELVVLEAQKTFPNAKIEVKLDLAKKQRILVIKF